MNTNHHMVIQIPTSRGPIYNYFLCASTLTSLKILIMVLYLIVNFYLFNFTLTKEPSKWLSPNLFHLGPNYRREQLIDCGSTSALRQIIKYLSAAQSFMNEIHQIANILFGNDQVQALFWSQEKPSNLSICAVYLVHFSLLTAIGHAPFGCLVNKK